VAGGGRVGKYPNTAHAATVILEGSDRGLPLGRRGHCRLQLPRPGTGRPHRLRPARLRGHPFPHSDAWLDQNTRCRKITGSASLQDELSRFRCCQPRQLLLIVRSKGIALGRMPRSFFTFARRSLCNFQVSHAAHHQHSRTTTTRCLPIRYCRTAAYIGSGCRLCWLSRGGRASDSSRRSGSRSTCGASPVTIAKLPAATKVEKVLTQILCEAALHRAVQDRHPIERWWTYPSGK
jgi:hypothetical protein